MDANAEARLREIYYDPARGLSGKEALWRRVQRIHPGQYKKAQVLAWVGKQALSQVNAPKTFKGFFRIIAPPKTFQIDVVHLSGSSAGANKDIKMMLIAVDVLSRYMAVVPIKRRSADMLVAALDALLDRVGSVVGLQSDDEFDTKAVRAWADRHNVLLATGKAKDDHQDDGDRLGIVDAAVRTLKRRITNYQVAHDRLRVGAEALQSLVSGYNTTEHTALRVRDMGAKRATMRTPEEVWEDESAQAYLYSVGADHNDELSAKVDLAVGDRVRRRVDRGKFDKEKPTFSADVFTIVRIDGRRYTIQDDGGKRAPRAYKYFELRKAGDDVQGTAAGAGRLAAAAARASKRRVVSRTLKELA